MVAIYEENFDTNPKTLCDWVRNFRIKKHQMKRKLRRGGDLRVCAILSTALLNAEHELRRKQQERVNRWTEVQTELCMRNYGASRLRRTSDDNYVKVIESVEECKQSEEITNLWKNELSDLDDFMRSISSSSGSCSTS